MANTNLFVPQANIVPKDVSGVSVGSIALTVAEDTITFLTSRASMLAAGASVNTFPAGVETMLMRQIVLQADVAWFISDATGANTAKFRVEASQPFVINLLKDTSQFFVQGSAAAVLRAWVQA